MQCLDLMVVVGGSRVGFCSFFFISSAIYLLLFILFVLFIFLPSLHIDEITAI